MNHDEPDFRKGLRKFSVVQQCPKCRQMSLSFSDNMLLCSNCGYEEKIPMVK